MAALVLYFPKSGRADLSDCHYRIGVIDERHSKIVESFRAISDIVLSAPQDSANAPLATLVKSRPFRRKRQRRLSHGRPA